MNIFFLSRDVEEAARSMIDKHIVKMPTESAQMLSSAHRVLDGEFIHYEYWDERDRTRKKKMWVLPDEEIVMHYKLDKEYARLRPTYKHPRGFALYSPTHVTHPSCAWTMEGEEQYQWHYQLTRAMLDEYTHRYGKKHGVERVMELLATPPKNIPTAAWSDPPLAMPDKYKTTDHVESYRQFYVAEKASFARWKNRSAPDWFIQGQANGNLL